MVRFVPCISRVAADWPACASNCPLICYNMLQEGKLGAGEAIMARRRQRRLVPDGALSSRASGNLGSRVGTGYSDEGTPMAKRAEAFRPRPRPSRVMPGSPGLGSPGGSTTPEAIFGARAGSAGKLPARPNGIAHSTSPPSERSTDENEVPQPAPQAIPASVQARMATFGR